MLKEILNYPTNSFGKGKVVIKTTSSSYGKRTESVIKFDALREFRYFSKIGSIQTQSFGLIDKCRSKSKLL